MSYVNLGADTEEECDEIEIIVDDGHQRVSALLKGASLDLASLEWALFVTNSTGITGLT